MNPIYVEYYPHTHGDCYKIDLPWTKYRRQTLVLCEASDGITEARRIAKREIKEHLSEALQEPVELRRKGKA